MTGPAAGVDTKCAPSSATRLCSTTTTTAAICGFSFLLLYVLYLFEPVQPPPLVAATTWVARATEGSFAILADLSLSLCPTASSHYNLSTPIIFTFRHPQIFCPPQQYLSWTNPLLGTCNPCSSHPQWLNQGKYRIVPPLSPLPRWQDWKGKSGRHLMEDRRLPRCAICQMLKISPLLWMSIPRRIQQILAWYSWEASDIGGGRGGGPEISRQPGNFFSDLLLQLTPDPDPCLNLLCFQLPFMNNENDGQMKLESNSNAEGRKSNYVLSGQFIPTTTWQ